MLSRRFPEGGRSRVCPLRYGPCRETATLRSARGRPKGASPASGRCSGKAPRSSAVFAGSGDDSFPVRATVLTIAVQARSCLMPSEAAAGQCCPSAAPGTHCALFPRRARRSPRPVRAPSPAGHGGASPACGGRPEPLPGPRGECRTTVRAELKPRVGVCCSKGGTELPDPLIAGRCHRRAARLVPPAGTTRLQKAVITSLSLPDPSTAVECLGCLELCSRALIHRCRLFLRDCFPVLLP